MSTTAKKVAVHFKSDDDVAKKEKEWGVKFDAVLVYRPASMDIGYKWIAQNTPADKTIQLVLELRDSIEAIANGRFDAECAALADEIKKAGRTAWLRLLHEFNLETSVYPWCIYPFTSAKIETFKKAWKRVVGVFRKKGAPVKFQLCYNVKNPRDDPTPFSQMFPGADVVDQVGVDVYNRGGLDQWHTDYPSFKSLFATAYTQLVGLNKTVFIGETSATDRGDKPKWIADAWNSLRTEFPKVKTVNWFCEDKEAHWGINTPQERDAWIAGFKKFKQ